jgi:outer membrane murein-binding lipoprotein Lpp
VEIKNTGILRFVSQALCAALLFMGCASAPSGLNKASTDTMSSQQSEYERKIHQDESDLFPAPGW